VNKIAVFLTASVLAASTVWASGHGWSYESTHWGGVCDSGQQQSPIDITNAQSANLPPISFDYKDSTLKLVDNGHTLQAIYAPGSGITVDGKRYELLQFHFHKPSEEKVNGQASDMVIHLVHKAADGKLAVVAVLLKQGAANPVVEKLWSHWPQGSKETEFKETINASQLLPDASNRGYFTFAGSLTTPPCTEGLTWFVLKTAQSISPEQLVRFSKSYPNNARPTQPINTRVIKVSSF